MRKLFTSLMVLCATVSMNAQDPTTWEIGQDVSDQLYWQDYSASVDGGDVWTATNGTGRGYGGWEMFNQPAGAETYQIFKIPAGIYTFNVQGFYRNNNWEENTEVNAEFYCNTLNSYDEESGDYVLGREFSTPLMRIAETNQTSTLLNNDGDWQNDISFTIDDQTYYAPNSMWGTSLHFEQGEYDNNQIRVIAIEDCWVKLGIRKTKAVSNDWVIWSNFRATYVGEAGEAALLMVAEDRYIAAKKNFENLALKIQDSYGALGGLMGDEMMEIENELDDTSAQGYENATESINAVMDLYQKYFADAQTLSNLIETSEILLNSTDYPGKNDFNAIVENAKRIEMDGTGDNEMTIDDPSAYSLACESLIKGRTTYICSQGFEATGYVDFSSSINNAWFCNNKYNPKWNEEKGAYVYSDDIEATWATVQEKNWKEVYTEHPDWVNIASDVAWTQDPNAVGEWIFNHNCTSGWMGGIDNVTMQHGYTAVGAWSGDPIGGYQEMRQVISGLPNGYYSMGALYINAGNDPHEGQYVYINAGNQPDEETMERAQFTLKGEHWWGGNADLWRVEDWQNLRTGMVYVDNGTVTIGSRSTWFYAVTGFQLYYYGENPDFTKLLTSEINETKELLETLTLAGDQAAVSSMIQEIPEKIEGQEVYEYTKSKIAEIKNYVSKANSYMASWSAEQKFMDLQANYEDGTTEYKMLDPTWVFALDYPSQNDATYLGAQAIDNDYAAYVNYLANREAMLKVADMNAELKSLLDSQAEAIAQQYSNAATLASYLEALAAPYNTAIFASLGSDKATADNPIDVTVLLINPSFDNGNTGWEGAFTVDGNFHNAESWNTSAFSVSQTVNSLPAGAYRVQVQSFYRDGGDATAAFNNLRYNDMFEPNVKLFANDKESDVMSLCQPDFTEPSMTERVTEWVKDDEATDVYHDINVNDPDYDPTKVIYKPIYAYLDVEADNPAHPWDNKVIDDVNYWYPNSMEGAMNRFAKSPEAYINTVDVYLTEDGSITFGVKKETGIGADWCIFDNFKLFYLGKDAALNINNAAANATISEIYSVSGVRQNSLNRGINIIKMSNGEMKKVLK